MKLDNPVKKKMAHLVSVGGEVEVVIRKMVKRERRMMREVRSHTCNSLI